MDDELSKCLPLDTNEEISTSMESDEMLNSVNKLASKVRIIKVNDFLKISQDNINRTKNDIIMLLIYLYIKNNDNTSFWIYIYPSNYWIIIIF